VSVKIGDKINMFLLSGNKVCGRVIRMPVATGDSWVIQTYFEGKDDLICYIQSFSHFFVMPEPPKESK